MAEDKIDPAPRKLVGKLGHAAAVNAIQLADEAGLLDENGHRARAFALTVFAAEELGKAFICTNTAVHARELDDWAAFYAMVRGHKKHLTKLLSALYLIQKVPGVVGQPIGKLAKELEDLMPGDLHDARMRALYVDIEGGVVAAPAMVADHAGAQERARALRHEVVGWAIPLSLEPLDEMTKDE